MATLCILDYTGLSVEGHFKKISTSTKQIPLRVFKLSRSVICCLGFLSAAAAYLSSASLHNSQYLEQKGDRGWSYPAGWKVFFSRSYDVYITQKKVAIVTFEYVNAVLAAESRRTYMAV